jgi:hypothetical protein
MDPELLEDKYKIDITDIKKVLDGFGITTPTIGGDTYDDGDYEDRIAVSMKPKSSSKTYLNGATIECVHNGFVVKSDKGVHVFETFEAMSIWLKDNLYRGDEKEFLEKL